MVSFVATRRFVACPSPRFVTNITGGHRYPALRGLVPILASQMSTHTIPAKALPRPSASLVVVNHRNEILLVHRNPKASSFAGTHVFPGGNHDAAQDTDLQMTAIRETFEESGLLIVSSGTSLKMTDAVLDEARQSIHAQQTNFSTFLSEHQLTVDNSSLLPFTTWVTPASTPRRFRTEFYVAFLPGSASASFSSGDKSERVPTHDGGQEVISARFLHPAAALQEFADGKIQFMLPQYYILATLCDILQGSENTASQREKVEILSRGAFGAMVINPKSIPGAQPEGSIVLSYEGDETHGGPKGRLHRAVLILGKGGIPKAVTLLRNFDIFSEIESNIFESSKL